MMNIAAYCSKNNGSLICLHCRNAPSRAGLLCDDGNQEFHDVWQDHRPCAAAAALLASTALASAQTQAAPRYWGGGYGGYFGYGGYYGQAYPSGDGIGG